MKCKFNSVGLQRSFEVIKVEKIVMIHGFMVHNQKQKPDIPKELSGIEHRKISSRELH